MNTPGATKAAAVIMDGRLAIDTEYGRKSAEGIADLIDQKTGAGELLEALKGLFEHCAMVHKHWGDNSNQKEADAAINTANAAIAKAEGN